MNSNIPEQYQNDSSAPFNQEQGKVLDLFIDMNAIKELSGEIEVKVGDSIYNFTREDFINWVTEQNHE